MSSMSRRDTDILMEAAVGSEIHIEPANYRAIPVPHYGR
jgi:hypothetical protein